MMKVFNVTFIEADAETTSCWSSENVLAKDFGAALQWANDHVKAMNKKAGKGTFEVCGVSLVNSVHVAKA